MTLLFICFSVVMAGLIGYINILRRRLLSKDNISKAELEQRLSKANQRVADELEARHKVENTLSVEADRAVRYEQAYRAVERKREEEKDKFNKLLKDKLKESNNKQRSTIKGQVAEQLAPYLPEFGYNPKDARFLGMPVDYIVFDGMSDGNIKEIVFVEVKTGGSQLSGVQRKMRDVIKDKKVTWSICRIQIPNES